MWKNMFWGKKFMVMDLGAAKKVDVLIILKI